MSKQQSTPRKYSNKLRRELAEAVREEAIIDKIIQRQPGTAVRLVFSLPEEGISRFSGGYFVGTGFAMVQWPDEWDSDYGLNLATTKAAFDIAKQILARDDAYVYVEALGLSIDNQLKSFHKVAGEIAAEQPTREKV